MDIFDIKIKNRYEYENVPKDFVPAMLLPSESVIAKKPQIYYSAVKVTTSFDVSNIFEHGLSADPEPFTEVELTFIDNLGNENTVVITGTKKWIIK